MIQVEGGSSANVATIEESMAKQQQLEQALRASKAECSDLEQRLEAAERGCTQASRGLESQVDFSTIRGWSRSLITLGSEI